MSAPRAWLARRWRRAVLLPVLISLAKKDLRNGHQARAKRRFERCARIAPFSFQAHFGLACVHLRERDHEQARRELLLAREIAPRRYRACRARLPDLVGRMEAEMVPVHAAGARSQSGSLSGIDPAGGLAEDSALRGDCVSRAEWTRFRRMGPIPKGASADVDWDGVISALYSDEPPTSGRR